MNKLSHFDDQGRSRMVDVSNKQDTKRVAIAKGEVKVSLQTLQMIKDDKIQKGDVLEVARVAGIMGVKKTPDLIPMCHPLLVSGIDIKFNIIDSKRTIEVIAITKITGKTGVEMEALTAVSTAALTIYDMCKAVDKSIEIGGIKLLKKTGGKSGIYLSDELIGRVNNIYCGTKWGKIKEQVDPSDLEKDCGLEENIKIKKSKQVSLLDLKSVTNFKVKDLKLENCDINIITEGLEISKLQLGTKLKLGVNIILEIKQNLVIDKGIIFANVLQGGKLKVDDKVEVLLEG